MKATDAARTSARATLTTRWARPSSARRCRAAPPAAHTAAVPRITTAQVAATATAPARGVSPGGRNVPAAARANSHPLGLSNWKPTPPSSPSGRAATVAPAPRLPRILAARYSREAEPTTLRARSIPGTARSTTPTPPATAKTRAPMPTAVPATCGAVRRNPKRLPQASSSGVFPPGVIDPTSATPSSPSSWLISPTPAWDASCPEVDNGPGRPVLYDPCHVGVASAVGRAWGGPGLEAGGRGRARGLPRPLRRLRLPAARPRRLDGVRGGRRLDPLRPGDPPPRRRGRGGV